MRKRLKPEAIGRARDLRKNATDAERILWAKLRELKALGYHFRRQAPFRSYTLDFVEHSHRLVVELDGDQHGHEASRKHDAIRDRVVRSQGYRVLRFWNEDLLKTLDAVVEGVLRTLAHPPPDPPSRLRRSGRSTSPQGGGDFLANGPRISGSPREGR
jgi:very-short-patch-repair endonuclease